MSYGGYGTTTDQRLAQLEARIARLNSRLDRLSPVDLGNTRTRLRELDEARIEHKRERAALVLAACGSLMFAGFTIAGLFMALGDKPVAGSLVTALCTLGFTILVLTTRQAGENTVELGRKLRAAQYRYDDAVLAEFQKDDDQ